MSDNIIPFDGVLREQRIKLRGIAFNLSKWALPTDEGRLLASAIRANLEATDAVIAVVGTLVAGGGRDGGKGVPPQAQASD